jgi:predicted transcriptional regulator
MEVQMGCMSSKSRTAHSPCISIRTSRIFLACLLFLLLISTLVAATEYTVRPCLNKEPGVSVAGEEVRELEVKTMPYWMFLLWLASMQIAPATEILFSARFLYVLGGYRRIYQSNVLKNTNRDRIYGFISSNPGTYPNEIIKETGLNKGVVEYHLGMLEGQNMIIPYKTRGKIHYFLNESTYGEKEKVALAALKNDKHRRIISEILNCEQITHETLAEKIGVSAPTINWHIRHLKEEGIVRADANGRYTEYSIDPLFVGQFKNSSDNENHQSGYNNYK